MEEGSTTKRSFPQAGRRREGKRNEGERERWMEKYVGDVCADAETERDKFPRIAWNRQSGVYFTDTENIPVSM